MATYAVGDIQGCFDELKKLLVEIDFKQQDRLWFVGDLVNRGPKSLEVLRFVRDLGERAVVVLGNHDLHLVTQHEGFERKRKDDTFDDVLAARDAKELVDWVTRILDEERGIVIASPPLEASIVEVDDVLWVHVFYESGLAINVLDDPKKRAALTHDWQKAMAEAMPTVPVQGNNEWTQFTLNWPKLGNYGSTVIASTDAVYNALYENYWYDKSKDTP